MDGHTSRILQQKYVLIFLSNPRAIFIVAFHTLKVFGVRTLFEVLFWEKITKTQNHPKTEFDIKMHYK